MGTIYKNGIEYGVGNFMATRNLTQAEYNALTTAEKNDGTIYFISDGIPTLRQEVDYVVDEGIDGIWTYRKWASGIAECWGQKTETNKSTTAWGSWYYVQISETAYPQGLFTSVKHVSGTVRWTNGSLISNVEATGSTTTAPRITGVRPTNVSTSGDAAGTWHAIGRWK